MPFTLRARQRPKPWPPPGGTRTTLEHVLQPKLEVTFSLGVVDQAEGVADGRVRSNQDGVIQDVDSLGPELQALVLKRREALGDAEVDGLQPWTSKAADLAVAEGSGA